MPSNLRHSACFAVCLTVLLASAATGTGEGPARALHAFAGARARLVWIQQVEGGGNDPFCWGDQLIIKCLDSDDGQGERTLLGDPGNYQRPLITPRGDRVVFSRFSTRKVYIVNWDGSGLRELTEGYGLAVWRDPRAGDEWVYFTRTGTNEWDKHHGRPVHRIKLDSPAPPELIWDRTVITVDNFQLSADGSRACAQFPHPRAGYALLPNRSWMPITRGCWTSMAPDNSYRVWVFDGKHRNLTVHDPDADRAWTVSINSAPGLDGYEVYHPRWSNHRRYMVLTGPYKVGEKGRNLIESGGREVELYAGRFNEDGTGMESWRRLTHNGYGDFYPDLWIESSEKAADGKPRPPPAAPTAWPFAREDLQYVWRNANQPDELPGPGGASVRHGPLHPTGLAVWGRHQEMAPGGGRFTAPDDEGRFLRAIRRHRALTLETLVTPMDTRDRGPVPILGYFDAEGTMLFGLAQQGSTLVVHGPDRPEPAGSLSAGQPTHVVLGCSETRLRIWLNGRRVQDRPTGPTKLAECAPGLLRFGGDAKERNWHGTLEGVALYSRVLTDEEVQLHQAWQQHQMDGRPLVESLVVEARLVNAPAPPSPLSVAPYRRALSGHLYEIESVLRGRAETGRVVIARWSLLDGNPVEADRIVGRAYRLFLEAFESNPQLESERLLMDAELLTLPLYYEIPAH